MPKTFDGVEYIPGMHLYDPRMDCGVIIPQYTEIIDDFLWVSWVDEGGDEKECRIDLLFASAEACRAFLDSPTNLCFVCERLLDAQDRVGGDLNCISVIHGGLFFRSSGNYGSAIFDPSNRQELEIVICDKCVYERRSYIKYYAEASMRPRDDRQWPLREPGRS